VQPHSEGEVRLASADPAEPPAISLNYFADPHDVQVMVAGDARALELRGATGRWPGMGPLAGAAAGWPRRTGHAPGDVPSDAPARGHGPPLLADRLPRDVDCRMGDVVDAELR
jgi:choline dehydrogenase